MASQCILLGGTVSEAAGKAAPSDVICPSTRRVATSLVAMRGVSAPCTFSRFYHLNVASRPTLASAFLPLASAVDKYGAICSSCMNHPLYLLAVRKE